MSEDDELLARLRAMNAADAESGLLTDPTVLSKRIELMQSVILGMDAEIVRTRRLSYRERLRQRRRGGRPKGRAVSLDSIERAYRELRDEGKDHPSQADVARRLNGGRGEPIDNVERALGDDPGFWRRLTTR